MATSNETNNRNTLRKLITISRKTCFSVSSHTSKQSLMLNIEPKSKEKEKFKLHFGKRQKAQFIPNKIMKIKKRESKSKIYNKIAK